MVTKKERQRALARQKWERQQARRLERRHKARRRAVISGAVVAVLAVLGGTTAIWWLSRDDQPASANPANTPSSSPTASPTPTPTPSPDATGANAKTAPRPTKAGSCTYVEQTGQDELDFGLPPATFEPAASGTATFTTSEGTITADLYPDKAGCAVNSLSFLADKNAFDDTTCGELALAPADARYLECGGLSDTGKSNPGYIFGNENEKTTVEPGYLVMAGPENRNGSRFLITYGEKTTFDEPVTVLGKISSGLDIVARVADGGLVHSEHGAGTEGVGQPKTELTIEDVKVTTT